MKNRTYSIQKILISNLAVLIMTSLMSLSFFGIFSYWSGIKQIESGNTASLQMYTDTLETEMNELSYFCQSTCYSDTTYQLLSTGYYSANDKIIYEYNLRRIMKGQVAPYSGLMIFSNNVDISLYQYGSLYSTKYAKICYDLKEELKDYWTNSNDSELETWTTYSNKDFSILMYASQYNGLYLCAIIDLNRFAPNQHKNADESIQICFFDDHQILSNTSEINQMGINHTDLLKKRTISNFPSKIINTFPIAESDISIASILQINSISAYFRTAIICILAMLFTFIILSLFMFFSFRDIIKYPIKQISSASVSLKQNDIDLFLTNNKSNIIEFQTMNNALTDLLHQKIQLEQENQLEKFEKDHAMLQYFQLQTRSHFFINCLKSLYSMLQSEEYEKTQRMILAFSNHLRYIFYDNLKLVSLKSELEEVNDYYNIILMDRSKPILLIQEVDKTLLDYQVPPLLIQTFLENSIKYNTQSEKMLCFTIHIQKTKLDDLPVVMFRLSDNGIGYDKDMLAKLNYYDSDLYEDYHVGISNLKKRIQIIYKSNFKFSFMNEPEGGACSIIYLPLEGK